jgi:hypothetical protein
MPLGLQAGYASSRAHNNNTSRSGFHNSHGGFKSFAQAARIEGVQCEFARTPTTTPTLTATPTTRVFITPTVSSKAQAARIEGGLCEFACAQQQHPSLGFS